MPHDKPVVAVENIDGHRFELIHIAAESARGTMLLLPGMGLSARQYIRFGEQLAREGISVFIHEWRGIGSSNRRAGRDCNWGYRELIDDITAARAAVRDQEGADYLLGGHSLGSQFACLSAGLSAEHCRGLVLVAGGSPYWRVFPLPIRLVVLGSMFAFPLVGRLVGYYPGKRLGFAGSEARDVMAEWTRSARTGRYRPAGIDTDLEAGMNALELPVLAVAMADDRFVPPASLQWLMGKLKNCTVSKQTMYGGSPDRKADHYAWMKSPDATVASIVQWHERVCSTETQHP